MGAGEGKFAPAIHGAAEAQSGCPCAWSLTATGAKQDRSDLICKPAISRGIPGSSFPFSTSQETVTSPLCTGSKWSANPRQLKSKGLNSHPDNLPCVSAPVCSGHLSQAAVYRHFTQYFILICWTGSNLPAALYVTHIHSEGQNFWGAMKDQNGYCTWSEEVHTHLQQGEEQEADVVWEREGPGAPKKLASQQRALNPSNSGAGGEWLRGAAFTPVEMGTAQLETGWSPLCSCRQQWPLDNDLKQPLLRSLSCFSKSS